MAAASDGTILVSNAASTAVAGADFQFVRARAAALKGVPGSVAAAEFITDGDVQNATSRWRPDPAVHGPQPDVARPARGAGCAALSLGIPTPLSHAKHGATAGAGSGWRRQASKVLLDQLRDGLERSPVRGHGHVLPMCSRISPDRLPNQLVPHPGGRW